MLQQLTLANVGPAASMELHFGSRLNVLTGDNGLGKSFLLDIAWWSLTRKWPAEINACLVGDLDLEASLQETRQVVLSRRTFVRQGEATNWLTSHAFGLPSSRAVEAERALEEASKAMADPAFGKQDALQVDAKLRRVLGDTDPFWMRWRFVAERKGWLP